MATFNNSDYGAYAGMSPSQRPAPFQVDSVQSPFGSQDPFGQRNQFIQQLNDRRMQNAVNFNQGGSQPPQSWGQSPFGGAQAAYQQYAAQQQPQNQQLGQSFMGFPTQSAPNSYAPATQYAPNAYGSNVPAGIRAWDDPSNPRYAPQQQPGGYNPPPASPTPKYTPYTNAKGEPFLGTVSYAPGTSEEAREQGYRQFANSKGYYQGGPPASQPGQAQSIQPPSQGTPYNPRQQPAPPQTATKRSPTSYTPRPAVAPKPSILPPREGWVSGNEANNTAYRQAVQMQALDPIGALRAAGFRI